MIFLCGMGGLTVIHVVKALGTPASVTGREEMERGV